MECVFETVYSDSIVHEDSSNLVGKKYSLNRQILLTIANTTINPRTTMRKVLINFQNLHELERLFLNDLHHVAFSLQQVDSVRKHVNIHSELANACVNDAER